MTSSFDHSRHRFGEPRYFEDLAVGERFYIPSRTMTEAHFAAFQTVSADNHPIHYDLEYCRERGHQGPLAHGFQILCFTARGQHVCPSNQRRPDRFCRAILKISKAGLCGDTLYPMLEITALAPQRSTGVVTFSASVHNQRGELVMMGEQKILLRKPSPS